MSGAQLKQIIRALFLEGQRVRDHYATELDVLRLENKLLREKLARASNSGAGVLPLQSPVALRKICSDEDPLSTEKAPRAHVPGPGQRDLSRCDTEPRPSRRERGSEADVGSCAIPLSTPFEQVSMSDENERLIQLHVQDMQRIHDLENTIDTLVAQLVHYTSSSSSSSSSSVRHRYGGSEPARHSSSMWQAIVEALLQSGSHKRGGGVGKATNGGEQGPAGIEMTEVAKIGKRLSEWICSATGVKPAAAHTGESHDHAQAGSHDMSEEEQAIIAATKHEATSASFEWP